MVPTRVSQESSDRKTCQTGVDTKRVGDPFGSPTAISKALNGLASYGACYLTPQFRVLNACKLHRNQGYHCDEDYE